MTAVAFMTQRSRTSNPRELGIKRKVAWLKTSSERQQAHHVILLAMQNAQHVEQLVVDPTTCEGKIEWKTTRLSGMHPS